MKLKIIFLMALLKLKRFGYIESVRCKITGLAVEGYKYSLGAYSPLRTFFMCKISMHSHVMAKLEGEAFALASHLSYWSTNPFQLCHLNYLVVIGKAPTNSGAHSHA